MGGANLRNTNLSGAALEGAFLEKADQLSDRIGIIDGGKIIALDSSAALNASLNQLDGTRVSIWSNMVTQPAFPP